MTNLGPWGRPDYLGGDPNTNPGSLNAYVADLRRRLEAVERALPAPPGSPFPAGKPGSMFVANTGGQEWHPPGANGSFWVMANGVPTWLQPPPGPGYILTFVGGVPVWLAPAANGSFLDLTGGVPTWFAPPPGTGYIFTYVGGVPVWLAPGAADSVLRTVGGVPAWEFGRILVAQGQTRASAINVATTDTLLVSVSIFVPAGAQVFVWAIGNVLEVKTVADFFRHDYTLKRSGTILDVSSVLLDEAIQWESTATLMDWDAPGAAGTYTYDLYVKYTAANTNGTPTGTGDVMVQVFR